MNLIFNRIVTRAKDFTEHNKLYDERYEVTRLGLKHYGNMTENPVTRVDSCNQRKNEWR